MNLTPYLQILRAALPAEDIFIHHMPETFKRGILILTGAGGAIRDPDLPDYKKARLQVVIRETEFQGGYDLAIRILNALDIHKLTQGSVYFKRVRALHDPIPFKRSDGGFIEFSINFETVYVEH